MILKKKVAVIAGSVLVAGTLLTGAAFATANLAVGAGKTAAHASFDYDKAVQNGKLTQAEADLLKQIDALRQTVKDQIAPMMEKVQSDAKALIDQAVKDGKITQEQADRLLKQGDHGGRGGMGHGDFGFGPRGPKGEGAKPDLDQAVKDGKITQAEADLHKKMEAMVDQAVKDGKITQEQADQLLNHGGHGGMGHGPMGPRGGKGR